jgi:Uma2 family endonuclease
MLCEITMPTATRKRWTYADYCRIPRDLLRHEIIDGRHFMNAAPDPYHQRVSRYLLYQLMTLVELPGLGEVMDAPIDVHLGRGTVVQPDLVVVLNHRKHIIGPKKLTGAPDLLAEILSPGTARCDRRTKLPRYARASVREFWLVDPAGKCIEQYWLRDGRYEPLAVCRDAIRPRILRRVSVDLGQVF